MSSDARPNFLLIITDQQRGDCLSIDGHGVLQTPNLDHLAATGARFRRAYSTCPSCVPTRRSLLAGQHPATHGMVGMQTGLEWNPHTTFAQALRDAGYHTMFVGRTMHQHPTWKRYGFEHFELSTSASRPGEPPSEYETLLEREDPLAGGFRGHGIDSNGSVARPWHMRESLHEVNWTVSRAIEALKRRDPTRPWLLVVSFFGPHPPLTPPAHYLDRYLHMDLPEPVIGDWVDHPHAPFPGTSPASDRQWLTGQRARQCRAGYFGYINFIDDQIGRLLGARWNAGPSPFHNTCTFFTSDHGEMLGDHGLFRKTYPYEASARVPLIVAGPDVKPGTVCDAPACHEDIFPTMLELAGLEIDQQKHPLDGRSLAPIARGDATRHRDILHGEHAICYRPEQANHYLTDGRHKYVWFSQTGVEHLFDIASDPNEMHDLRQREPERLATWRQRLVEHLQHRPEGFSDGRRLMVGRPHRNLVPGSEGTTDAS